MKLLRHSCLPTRTQPQNREDDHHKHNRNALHRRTHLAYRCASIQRLTNAIEQRTLAINPNMNKQQQPFAVYKLQRGYNGDFQNIPAGFGGSKEACIKYARSLARAFRQSMVQGMRIVVRSKIRRTAFEARVHCYDLPHPNGEQHFNLS